MRHPRHHQHFAESIQECVWRGGRFSWESAMGGQPWSPDRLWPVVSTTVSLGTVKCLCDKTLHLIFFLFLLFNKHLKDELRLLVPWATHNADVDEVSLLFSVSACSCYGPNFQQGTQGKFVPAVFMLSCKRVFLFVFDGAHFTFSELFSKSFSHCFCLVLKQITVLYEFFKMYILKQMIKYFWNNWIKGIELLV